MIFETICAFVAALGFAIIFNIKGSKVFFAALGGALGWFVYSIALKNNLSTVAALFFSSIAFSIYSEIFARILKTPVTTLIVCCLIPLVPGAGMYYTMYTAVTGDAQEALQLGLNTIANAGTLALGVIFVSSITRQISHLKK